MKTFYPSFFSVFPWLFLGGYALALPGLAVLSRFGLPPSAFAWALPSGALLAVPLTLMIVLSERVRSDADGLRAADVWGLRRSMSWADIHAVKRFRMLNVQWLRLFPADGTRPLWLPIFLSRRDSFLAAVKETAPADHPLVRSLGGDRA